MNYNIKKRFELVKKNRSSTHTDILTKKILCSFTWVGGQKDIFLLSDLKRPEKYLILDC